MTALSRLLALAGLHFRARFDIPRAQRPQRRNRGTNSFRRLRLSPDGHKRPQTATNGHKRRLSLSLDAPITINNAEYALCHILDQLVEANRYRSIDRSNKKPLIKEERRTARVRERASERASERAHVMQSSLSRSRTMNDCRRMIGHPIE